MTVVGVTAGNAEAAQVAGAFGVVMPRSSGWKMSDVDFFNFPAGTTVMQTCSKCDNPLLFTNNVNEYFMDGLTFTNISGKYLKMVGIHQNVIIYNTDGSLSAAFDGGSRTSATLVKNFPHLAGETNCLPATTPSAWNNGILCDQTTIMRGVMFTNIMPEYSFKHIGLKAQHIADSSEWVAEDSTSFSEIYSEFGGM